MFYNEVIEIMDEQLDCYNIERSISDISLQYNIPKDKVTEILR